MRIIELNGGFLRQLSPVAIVPEKPADQICQRTSDQKIFLHKAQLLPGGCRVIGIEHSGQRFGFECRAQRPHEISRAKLLKINEVCRRRRPQADRVDGFPSITYDWPVKRNTEQGRWSARYHLDSSIPEFERDVQLDIDFLVMAADLPWITVAQPVVGVLLLPAVHKRLPKHPIFVAQTIARRRKFHRGHRVEETRRKPAQASVSQSRIRFLLDQLQPVDIFLFDHLLHDRIEQKIPNVVGERTS